MTLKPATLPTLLPSSDDLAAPLPATLTELPAGAMHKVGDYKLLGVLGSGGMGVVYKAFDQKLSRIVALKMLKMGVEANTEEVVRFRAEAEALGQLQHPNIVQVFDFGTHESSPFLVMEFVNGGSLDSKLAHTPQPPRLAGEMIETLARAMQTAHEAHIIHRDLKPANVLLTSDGKPKITDFGLAKHMELGHGLTQTGAVMGTPSYMAPEQAQGKKDIGPGVDVYALGAILYEMLTGRPPFRGTTLQETLEQVCMTDPAPPSQLVPRLPRDLQTICLKCLHKSPARRYASAGELADDVRNWLDGMPVKARPTHSIERLIRFLARRPLRTLMGLTTGLILILTIVLGLVVREYFRAQELSRQKVEATAAKAEVDRERREHAERDRQSNDRQQKLQTILDIALERNLNTTEGLDRLRATLDRESAQMEKDHDNNHNVKLGVLVSAYHKLASRYRKLGLGEVPLTILNKAESLAKQELKTHKDDPATLFLLAQVHEERGLVHKDNDDTAKASADFESALNWLKEVEQQDWCSEDITRRRSEVLHQLGELQSGNPKTRDKALACYNKALEIRRGLVKVKHPTDEDRRDLARTLGYMGDLYLNMNDRRKEADAVYWESHRLREKLLEEKPKDAERKFQLARSWTNFADLQRRGRTLDSALWFYAMAHKLQLDLHLREQGNRDYCGDLVWVSARMVELELLIDSNRTERLGRALRMQDRAESVIRAMLEDTPEDPSLMGSLCESLSQKARTLLYQNKRDEAKPLLREARELLEKAEKKRGLNSDESYTAAAVYSMLAEIHADEKSTAADCVRDANKYLTQAVEKGFCRLHGNDVTRDRGFVAVKEQEWFLTLLTR